MKPGEATAYLALGSNEGDRAENLRRAVRSLHADGVTVEAKSGIYESESVEGGGPGDFLNAVVRVATTLDPGALLERLQRIETELGRPQTEGGRHRGGSRAIDLDLLFYGEVKFDSPELELPHPRLHRRPFVLRPLLDVLEGGWVRPSPVNWEE